MKRPFVGAAMLAALIAAPVMAQSKIAVPDGDTAVEGNDPNSFPFSAAAGTRDRQLLGTDAFSSSTRPSLLTAFNLRVDASILDSSRNINRAHYFDATNTTGDATSRVRSAIGSPNASSGNASSLGLLAQVETAAAVILPAAAPVPESIAWAMMILGMGAVGYSLRRRQTMAYAV